MVLLTSASVAGCGPRFVPPAIDPAGLAEARKAIMQTAPAAGMPDAPEAMLADISRRLDDAAKPLCSAYRIPDCTLRISLVPSASARAAMTGEGRAVITLGMLRLLGSRDEVAAVLAHEFGHHLANHLGRRRVRGLAAGTAAGTLLGAVVPFGGLAGWALGEGAALAGSRGAQLAFSKEEEREADYLGAYLVARAGYDLDRAGLLWVRLTRGGPQETTGLLDSHPAGPERLAPGSSGDPPLPGPDAAAIWPAGSVMKGTGRSCATAPVAGRHGGTESPDGARQAWRFSSPATPISAMPAPARSIAGPSHPSPPWMPRWKHAGTP